MHKLLIGTVVPRPIAWMLSRRAGAPATRDPANYNLAPFSYFNAVSSKPAVLSTVFSYKADSADAGDHIKDTLRNIRLHPEYSINVVSGAQLDAMNATATDFPPEISELATLDLAHASCEAIEGLRLTDSLVSFECRLRQEIAVGDGPGSAVMVLSDVHRIHVSDGIVEENLHVDINALNPLARLAGNQYAVLGEILERERKPFHPRE